MGWERDWGLRMDRWGHMRMCGIAHRWDALVCTGRGSDAGLKTNLFAPVCQWVNRGRYTAEQVREWPLCCLHPGPSSLCLKIAGALAPASVTRAEFVE